ncbi:MAG: hypothetical protein HY537_16375 [Deltaproteobacteria bacterium]|nr:hypothetical protein [Deltaproteobacteria bacterium]
MNQKRFWNLPIEVVSECFRVWASFFPTAIRTILDSSVTRESFSVWLREKKDELQEIHGGQASEKRLASFLKLALDSWSRNQDICNFLVFEGAIALLSTGSKETVEWGIPGTPSISYAGNSARILARINMDEKAQLQFYPELLNEFVMTSEGESISIEGSEVVAQTA